MGELIAMEDEDLYTETFDFNSPETVIFEVVVNTPEEYGPYTWKQCSIETVSVIGGKEGVTGAASYEMSYGGFLDYRIEEQLLCPGEGWWTIEEVTGFYYRGEWGLTDDDFELYMDDCRPATPEEIALA